MARSRERREMEGGRYVEIEKAAGIAREGEGGGEEKDGGERAGVRKGEGERTEERE